MLPRSVLLLWLLALGGLVPLPLLADERPDEEAEAIFAGGCFWCMEPPFDAVEGVLSTTSGYSGGDTESPSYEEVTGGDTGHYEVVRVTYDPSQVSYQRLLDVYWRNIDPLDDGGQFCDRGDSYRAAIFVADANERRLAEASRERIAERFKDPVVTEILEAAPFYPAEDYHQNYYRENPVRYRFYRATCGRDGRLRELWGDEAGG
ncbi:peptide-methionine (S)-S-oxide reductase MsrA [Methylonatrum kenyense]|uniref:peptide-methionine (S)-S-oxide reductase MsrA n=1 Tax=Methylonatrum kenyense TaxID=455253 RepID=UPI0020BE8E1E|nr:peptide-methionine (S)-S-oxide reductase MsrA [Methylonatrum kenyense]MCK8515124.1 peptide-methionine (S)-S-oxide reductase MsrA [Methylonatrum kenyense]